ncbi:MAG: hypothetical protein R3A47_04000 [Polyangiales bacterium]
MNETFPANWHVWMTQAQRFAAAENYLDAVARMQELCSDVRKAVGSTNNAGRRLILEQELSNFEAMLALYTDRYKEWNSAKCETSPSDDRCGG